MEIVCSKMDVIDEDIDLADDAALLTRALLDLAVKETSAENQTTAFLSLRQVAK